MILHLDMDAFFASVEQRDNPELAGKPVIIGGSQRGVVSTASYEARVFGIHSAMPIATAKRLCPHGIFLPGNYRKYSEVSAAIFQELTSITPVIQQASIDEAYLDLASLGLDWERMEEAGRRVQQLVGKAAHGLTCSVGIAPIKFLAKICSEVNKPNGLFVLPPQEMDSFLCSLEVGKLPGVGKHMRASLASFGIFHIWQLRKLSRAFLVERYGKWGAILHDRAHGIDPRTVHPNEPAKSESAENTFAKDTSDITTLAAALLHHAERVGRSLCKKSQLGRTITIKIKFSDFRQITRSCTLPARTNCADEIYHTALALLAAVSLPRAVRLIGLCVSGFEPRSEQLPLPGITPPACRHILQDSPPDILSLKKAADLL